MSKPNQLPFFQEFPLLSLTHKALLGHLLRRIQMKLQHFIQMAMVRMCSWHYPAAVSLVQCHHCSGSTFWLPVTSSTRQRLCASCRGPKLSENSISKDDALGSYSRLTLKYDHSGRNNHFHLKLLTALFNLVFNFIFFHLIETDTKFPVCYLTVIQKLRSISGELMYNSVYIYIKLIQCRHIKFSRCNSDCTKVSDSYSTGFREARFAHSPTVFFPVTTI